MEFLVASVWAAGLAIGIAAFGASIGQGLGLSAAMSGISRNPEAAGKIQVNMLIGLAMIEKGRCLPWAHATPCIMCEEVCPTPKKAIWFEKAKVRDRKGKVMELQQPRVDLELCIGCGICEAKCPVLGRPAIYVSNVGESRSKENQLLLSERKNDERHRNS